MRPPCGQMDETARHHHSLDRRAKAPAAVCAGFLVQYEDGRKVVIEVKDPSRINSNDVQRKRKAAEMWCKQRKMEYVIATMS